ncbi:methyltransferase [Cordyceps militaris]|uniref:Methyltransferase n=1 Tax=Cordyceps militaris TaxID=73501 RepID=A0A2H4SI56_CORMI|nr:methyltransferase [Cordyceps militaris]
MSPPPPSIYAIDPPPVNLIHSIAHSGSPPPTPSSPSYGIDSPLGLVLSSLFAPLYLYATLRGKSTVWDTILASLPPPAPSEAPALDVGCGRGLVLLKLAGRHTHAYGIDIFRGTDQTSNTPEATYSNAAALGVVEDTVLHAASFAVRFPFVDGAFALVTSSLAVHNAGREGRRYFGEHRSVLEDEGWTDVVVSFVGWRMMFGLWPCQMLVATKPP